VSYSRVRWLAALALVVASPVALAQGHDCAKVLDPEDRLACYDAAFPPVRDEAAIAAAAAARREKALQEFGLDAMQLRERSAEAAGDELPSRIEASITDVTYRASGQRVVTLDNGQVWLLTEATSKGPLKPGDRIAIRAAALGSFVLVAPGRATLRARRLN